MKMKYFNTVAQACAYTGAQGELTFVTEDCTLRIHDGCTCGGKILNTQPLTEEELKAVIQQCIDENKEPDLAVENFVIDGDVITLTMNDGTAFPLTLTHPEEEGVYVTPDMNLDVDSQTFTFTTATDEGEATGSYVVDLTALFTALTSPDAPNFTGTGVTYDTGTNTYTITDTDTTIPDTFFRTEITTDATGNIVVTETDVNGNVVSTASIPLTSNDDVTTLLASISNLTQTDRGLSLGEVRIPKNRALTLAELAQTNADKVALAFADNDPWTTNRAVEPVGGGVSDPAGNISFDMSWGYDTAVDGFLIPTVSPHTYVQLKIPQMQTAVLDAPTYTGQLVTIRVNGDHNGEIDLSTNATLGMYGNARNTPNGPESSATTPVVGDANVYLRAYESVTYRGVTFGNNSLWVEINRLRRDRYGANYRENFDGTYDIWGNAPFNSAAFPAFTTLPVIVEDILNGTFIGLGGKM